MDANTERSASAAREEHDNEELRGGGPRQRGARPISVTALTRRLVDDIATLFRKELALATSEILHATHDLKAGMNGMLTGAAILYAGFASLLAAAVLALAEIMPAWGGALIVGAVAVLIGIVLLRWGRSRVAPTHFAPERAAASLREDREMIRRQTR
jgi:hypothetical protein